MSAKLIERPFAVKSNDPRVVIAANALHQARRPHLEQMERYAFSRNQLAEMWPEYQQQVREEAQAIIWALDQHARTQDQVGDPLKEKNQGLMAELHEVEQVLGAALGYPWFKDHQKNFPGATVADGVCVGEAVAGTLAQEAADALASKDEEVKRLREAWDWLSGRTNLELSFEHDFPEEGDGAWQVHRISGNRSDLEWGLIGSGKTALEAVTASRQALQGDADVCRGGGG